MRWVTVATEQGPRACGVYQGEYIDVNAADPEMPSSVRELLALGREWERRAWAALPRGAVRHTPANVRLLAPVPDPRKIICIGLNYRDHAAESGVPVPPEPVLFSKYSTTLIGHLDRIVLPRVSQQVDYEAELVVVIGRGGKHIQAQNARDHVGGYTVGHDVSARDWQLHKPAKQWMAGKTFDTFAPTGPELVSPDEVADPHKLGIRLRLNGQTMQESNTSQLIFGVDELIAFMRETCTLEPGDLILTGTPSGVGMAMDPPRFLQAGDRVRIEIEGLGAIEHAIET